MVTYSSCPLCLSFRFKFVSCGCATLLQKFRRNLPHTLFCSVRDPRQLVPRSSRDQHRIKFSTIFIIRENLGWWWLTCAIFIMILLKQRHTFADTMLTSAPSDVSLPSLINSSLTMELLILEYWWYADLHTEKCLVRDCYSVICNPSNFMYYSRWLRDTTAVISLEFRFVFHGQILSLL